MAKRPSRPRDPNLLARDVFMELVGEKPKEDPDAGKNPAAVELGRMGGAKGGRARAKRMTPEERSDAALRAVQARWAKRKS